MQVTKMILKTLSPQERKAVGMKWKEFHVLYHTRCYSLMSLGSLIFLFSCITFKPNSPKSKSNIAAWSVYSTHNLDAHGQTGISVHWPTPSSSLPLDKDSLSASQNLFAARAWQLIWEEAHTQSKTGHERVCVCGTQSNICIYTADLKGQVRTKGRQTAGSHIRVRLWLMCDHRSHYTHSSLLKAVKTIPAIGRTLLSCPAAAQKITTFCLSKQWRVKIQFS